MTMPSKMIMMIWAMNGDGDDCDGYGDDDGEGDGDGDGDGDLVVVPLPKNFMSPPSIMSQKHRGM